ncbi:hypothetical protein H6G80_30585 [Nostoc sp. FACHB-87]|uniref:hypothetical protein n=1 Tax=Nostocaceae TaxID=1162 RepID=UPI0016826367|nr:MULTISPECIES: hypothetical protein [Nostocaceae]MBD2458401.1 hypothetical protein [Nostoc sp. FACHB-87]MBD2479503.1 hypothetical protein [Anabaena sp. FACHB-83]
MYNIAEIDREIAVLQEQRDYEIIYWFEMGESDRGADLPPQYAENPWYSLGWHDRDYQLKIGFNLQPVTFDHF